MIRKCYIGLLVQWLYGAFISSCLDHLLLEFCISTCSYEISFSLNGQRENTIYNSSNSPICDLIFHLWEPRWYRCNCSSTHIYILSVFSQMIQTQNELRTHQFYLALLLMACQIYWLNCNRIYLSRLIGSRGV